MISNKVTEGLKHIFHEHAWHLLYALVICVVGHGGSDVPVSRGTQTNKQTKEIDKQ